MKLQPELAQECKEEPILNPVQLMLKWKQTQNDDDDSIGKS